MLRAGFARGGSEEIRLQPRSLCLALACPCPSAANTHLPTPPPTLSRRTGRGQPYFVVIRSGGAARATTRDDERGGFHQRRTCFQHQQQLGQHNTTLPLHNHASPPPAAAAWRGVHPSAYERRLYPASLALVIVHLPKPLQPRRWHFHHEQALRRLPRQPAPAQKPATTRERQGR